MVLKTRRTENRRAGAVAVVFDL